MRHFLDGVSPPVVLTMVPSLMPRMTSLIVARGAHVEACMSVDPGVVFNVPLEVAGQGRDPCTLVSRGIQNIKVLPLVFPRKGSLQSGRLPLIWIVSKRMVELRSLLQDRLGGQQGFGSYG